MKTVSSESRLDAAAPSGDAPVFPVDASDAMVNGSDGSDAPPTRRSWRQSDSLLVRSLAGSRLTQAALLVLLTCIGLAIAAPWIASQNPFDPAALDLLDAFTPPGGEGISGRSYWLGADDQGRDVWSAILYGLRMSVLVGGLSVLLSMLIGVTLGVLAGYRGGWLDVLIMRIADVQLTFPVLLVALLIFGIARGVLPSGLGTTWPSTSSSSPSRCPTGFSTPAPCAVP